MLISFFFQFRKNQEYISCVFVYHYYIFKSINLLDWTLIKKKEKEIKHRIESICTKAQKFGALYQNYQDYSLSGKIVPIKEHLLIYFRRRILKRCRVDRLEKI